MSTIWLIRNLLFCYAVGRVSGQRSSSWAADVQCTRPGLHCNKKCDALEMCIFDNGGSSSVVVEYCGDLICHSPPGECNPSPLDAPCTYEFACQSQGQFPHPYDCTRYCSCDSDLQPSCSTCTLLGTAYNANSGNCDATLESQACTDNPVNHCEASGGIYPLEEDPTIYYVCLPDGHGNLQPRFYKCLDGNEFDVNTKQCSTFRCSEPGFFPDPMNCTSYYYCSPELIPYHYSCPKDQIYNSTVGKCMDGDCSLPEDPSSCDEVGIFPDEEDCTMYYVCLPELLRIHVKCPGNTHYDRVTKICVYGPCEDSVTTPPPFTSPLLPCTPPGIFPDPDDCTKYYICLNDGTWIHQSCNTGHFDAEKKTCVPGPCPTQTDPTTTTSPICTTPGIFPDPDDCTKYYICLNDGTWIHQSCSTGHFDAKEKTCVPGPCITKTYRTTTTSPICSTPGIFPDPDDCTKYYFCLNNGTWIHQSCNTGHFDAEEKTCVPGPCPTQADPTTTTSPICSTPGIFPDPDDCTKYYICLNDNTWIHQSCNTGHFDAAEKMCVPGPCSTSFVCTEPGYFPNPLNCTTYFFCSDDLKANEESCPSGFHFETLICVEGPCEKPALQTSFICTILGFFTDQVDCTFFVSKTS